MNWELALEQQSDLSVSQGSLSEVAAAVRRGADLNLYMTTETYEETLYFQQTYSGEGDAFAGFLTQFQHAHSGGQPTSHFFKYDALGSFAHQRWMWNNETTTEDRTYSYGVYRWFVADRFRQVYENDASGNRVQGDLDELKECVRTGQIIKVGVEQLFGFVDDNEEGEKHISFLNGIQPLIINGEVALNCELAPIGTPDWPLSWLNGLHLAMMVPSTSGEIDSYVIAPGSSEFEYQCPRRAMQWLVAE